MLGWVQRITIMNYTKHPPVRRKYSVVRKGSKSLEENAQSSVQEMRENMVARERRILGSIKNTRLDNKSASADDRPQKRGKPPVPNDAYIDENILSGDENLSDHF